MELKDFLNEFGDSLRSKVKTQPLYHPKQTDDWDDRAREKLQTLLRQPFPSQMNAILPVAKGFYREDKKSAIMVGEMGVGKTICAIAVAALSPRRDHRTLIMSPGHLVEKWLREIRETVPGAAVVNLNKPGLQELFALKGKKPEGQEFFVMGKERAKNHFAFRPAVAEQRQVPRCPECHGIIDESKVNYRTRKAKCPACAAPLWQADNARFRRYSKAEFIKRYLPKGTFDLLIADELHEYKSGSTAQGQALACLAAVAQRTLGLTGTLMGGYATGLFYLFWRLFPSLIKDKTAYGAEKTFASQYGVLETIQKISLSDNACSIGGQKNRETVHEKPGASPLILSDFLLEHSVFLRLADISSKLPPYAEEVVGVAMLPEQAEAYDELAKELGDAARQALAQGSQVLLGALVNSLLAYPDGCRRGEEVYHPRTGQLVAEAPMIDAALLPKEEKLLELVQEEVSQGRKCLICLEHTGTRDLIPVLVERLEQVGLSPLVLRANNPPPAAREQHIRKLSGLHDVLITNPNLIKTGLDLIEFPTLIFFQTGYSVYTLRQASRRSWRIGQDKPVKVYYLAYSGTMQETALALMANKMETALAVEGDLTDKGLLALADSGNSMLLEMARSLVDGRQFSLEDAWQAFQAEAVQADALLGGEPEATVQTTTQTTTITQGDRQTTVSVTRVVRGKVYPTRKKGVGIGVVGKHKLIFQAGSILFNGKPVGQYDRSGQGWINGKPIRLEKAADGYLLVELRPAAA